MGLGGGWESHALGCLLATALSLGGCGPDVGGPLGSLEGGSGGEGEVWEPGDPEDPDAPATSQPGPKTLAMAYEGEEERIVSLGPGGVFEPYGPLLPPAPAGARFTLLEWKGEVGRGAVVRRSETASSVVFIDHGELTTVYSGAPRVQWIELSREAHLVVLHHQDDSTTVVDGDGTVVLELDPRPSFRPNWLGFSDGDRWVIWSRDVDPSAVFSDLDYWLHDFSTGRTRHFVTWPYPSDARVFTFRSSILRQHDDQPETNRWLAIGGGEVSVDVPLAELTFGPGRYVFAGDRAYRLQDGELEDLGEQVLPLGYIRRFEPGRHILVETEDTLAYFDSQGRILHEHRLSDSLDVSVGSVPDDPDDLSILLRISDHSDGWTRGFQSLWRPEAAGSEQQEWIPLGEDDPDNLRTTRFAPDGSFVSLFEDDSMTVVYPDADEEVPLQSAYRLEGFYYAYG